MKYIFSLILIAMLGVTTWASLEKNVFIGFEQLFSERWGIATLFDTYFSFLLLYLWIAYREKGALSRIVWLLLVLGLGTIAISGYGLWQIKKGRALL
ncbi:MAG: DUF1475 family protein [Bdellovibrionales bacterium]|nr:DUF1475 family protein [Bdellovibrionales bacterium]